MPIEGGDRVVLLLIVESPYTDRFSQYWTRSLPIYGKYDDYGGIDLDDSIGDEEDKANQLVWHYMCRLFEEDLYEGPNTRDLGQPAPSKALLSPANILSWVSEGDLYIEDDARFSDAEADKKLQVHQVLVRADIWEAFLGQVVSSTNLPDVEFVFEYLKGKYQGQVRRTKAAAELLDKLSDEDSEALTEIRELASGLSHYQYPGRVVIGTRSHVDTLKMLAQDAAEGLDDPNNEMVLRRAAELCFVESVMRESRMEWYPVREGTGSQYVNEGMTTQLHLEMARAGLRRMIRNYDDMQDEDGLLDHQLTCIDALVESLVETLKAEGKTHD
jgi:hypothetical protein|tara:strand:+ start:102177 stop:103163 length:987 start_codon:yes stop_codon:yes gene_type:complete